MTGTASTEAEEFGNIYGLDVVEIPTNVPIARIDEDDEVYRTFEEKYRAIVDLIAERRTVASRSWSARPRSKSPNCSRRCCRQKGRHSHPRQADRTGRARPTRRGKEPTICARLGPI
jgi:hypothetical protein